ncbi:hypothetical protein S1OALGB6SA_1497 [Olavius algarvensis spirochete endosymbiont]|nr:hypothetical protein S1OALGB6SA_1497 [Olavius algarvensis spirochete endosymbiont]
MLRLGARRSVKKLPVFLLRQNFLASIPWCDRTLQLASGAALTRSYLTIEVEFLLLMSI